MRKEGRTGKLETDRQTDRRQEATGHGAGAPSSDLLHLGDEVVADPGQLVVLFRLEERRPTQDLPGLRQGCGDPGGSPPSLGRGVGGVGELIPPAPGPLAAPPFALQSSPANAHASAPSSGSPGRPVPLPGPCSGPGRSPHWPCTCTRWAELPSPTPASPSCPQGPHTHSRSFSSAWAFSVWYLWPSFSILTM